MALRDHYANGVRLLANICLQKGHDAHIIVFKAFDDGKPRSISRKEWNLLRAELQKLNPEIIATSFTSLPLEGIKPKNWFSFLKKTCPEALLICGGFGPTLEPEKFLKAGADFAIRGEGEEAVMELLEAKDREELKSAQNFAWLDNRKLVQNPMRPLINLAHVPDFLIGNTYFSFIDNDSISYVDPMLSLSISTICSSRGCVGHCTYCSGGNWLKIYKNHHDFVKRYRTRPIDAVISECEHAKSMGSKYMLFMDEYFIRPEEEFYRFFSEYKKRVNLPFGLMVHSAFLDKDDQRFEALFQSGIHDVEIGVQSASPHICNEVFRRDVPSDLQMRMLKKYHEHWIAAQVDFITGHSLESEDDFRLSLKFVKELPYDPLWPARTGIAAFILGLFPGAPLAKLFPDVTRKPLPQKEKEFRQRMLYLRHILKDDDAFFSIYDDPVFRDNPIMIRDVFFETFQAGREKARQDMFARIRAKKVWFWGAGREYHTHRHLFKDIKALGMIVDVADWSKKIDGMDVFHPHDVLEDDETPIVMFTSSPGVIAGKVLREHGRSHPLFPCFRASYRTLFME